jgi:hypothetical protein
MMPVALISLLIGTEDTCLPLAGKTRHREASRNAKYLFGTNYILVSSLYWQSSG